MTQFRLSRLFPVARRSRPSHTRRRGTDANADTNAAANAPAIAENTIVAANSTSVNSARPISTGPTSGRGRRRTSRRLSHRSSSRRMSARQSLSVVARPLEETPVGGHSGTSAEAESSTVSGRPLRSISEQSSHKKQQQHQHHISSAHTPPAPTLPTVSLPSTHYTETSPQPLSVPYSYSMATSPLSPPDTLPEPSHSSSSRRVSWQLSPPPEPRTSANSQPRLRLTPSLRPYHQPLSYSPEHSPTHLTPANSQDLQVEHMRCSSSSIDDASPVGTDHNFTEALRQLSLSPRQIHDNVGGRRPRITLDSLLPEVLESIFIYLPVPRKVARVCRLFNVIVSTSKAFKRRWLRTWLHPRLPDAFLPAYSDLCTAIEARKPFNVLVEIINLMRLGRRSLCSTTQNGSITRLVDGAASHPDAHLLMPFMVDSGLQLDRYIRDHTAADDEATEGGNDPERRSSKDYLTPVKLAAKSSKRFCTDLARSPTYFTDTELAFAIVLHERLDVAQAMTMHQQHTLDILAESVDRQYTKGMAWAFRRGVTPLQLQNPLYLRLCIEKADVESASEIIDSDAAINISPSGHLAAPTVYSATSLLEFAIQCYFAYHEEGLRDARRRMIELFLTKGADPNADGGRPLSLCVSNHSWELINLLLSHGADPRENNNIAVRIATEFNYKDMARMLHDIIKTRNEIDKQKFSGHHRYLSAYNRFSQSYEPSGTATNADSDTETSKNGVKNKVRRWTLTTMRKMQTAGRRRYTESDSRDSARLFAEYANRQSQS